MRAGKPRLLSYKGINKEINILFKNIRPLLLCAALDEWRPVAPCRSAFDVYL